MSDRQPRAGRPVDPTTLDVVCSRRDALRIVLAAGPIGYLALPSCGRPGGPFGPPDEAVAHAAPGPTLARKAQVPSPDFYVDPVDGDDGRDGTDSATAWRSLAKLEAETRAGVVHAGHVVSFAPGATVHRNEAAEGKFWFEGGITYTGADPGDRAVFEGTGDRPFGIRGHGTRLAHLRLRGGNRSVLHTDGTAPVDVALTHVDCEHGGGIGFQQLSGAGAGAGGVFAITGGSFSHNGTIGLNLTGARDTTVDGVTATGNGTVGVRLQSSGPECVIQNCVAHGNGANGIGVDTPRDGGGNEIVQHNTVYGNATAHDDTSGIKTFSRGTIVRYNRVYENGLAGSINHGVQLEAGSRDCLCYANLCYRNLTAGISFAGSGHRIYHNTCHDNGESGIATFSASIEDCDVRNNLLVDNGVYSFRSYGSVELVGLVLDSNLHEHAGGPATIRYAGAEYASLEALRSAVGQEAHGIEGESRLVASQLKVQPRSAATGAGAAGVGVLQDFEGRAYGDPPTIGAFEVAGRRR